MEKNLSQFTLNEQGFIKAICCEKKLKRRLYDMGLTPGTLVTLKKFAPLMDPIALVVRGYNLSIRKAEAECIIMEESK